MIVEEQRTESDVATALEGVSPWTSEGAGGGQAEGGGEEGRAGERQDRRGEASAAGQAEGLRREEGSRQRAIGSREIPSPSLNALLPTPYCLPPIATVEP